MFPRTQCSRLLGTTAILTYKGRNLLNRCAIVRTLFLLATVFTCSIGCAQQHIPGGIRLLPGYTATQAKGVDASIWIVKRTGGPTIRFEVGPTEGSFADPKDKATYSWYQEQTINRCKVRVALVKRGLKTDWEPDDTPQGQVPGNILLITFLIAGEHSDRTANFVANIGNEHDLGEVLLIAATYDPLHQ